MRQDFLDLHGLRFSVTQWGEPALPRLFLVHGYLEAGPCFDLVCRELCQEFCCIAPDLRGYGQSGPTPNPTGYFFLEYLWDLHAILRHYSPTEPLNLLGHSLGGNVVAMYAGVYPERVKNLIDIEGFGTPTLEPVMVPQKIRHWVEESQVAAQREATAYQSPHHAATKLRQRNPTMSEALSQRLVPHMTVRTARGHIFRADPKHKWPEPYKIPFEQVAACWQAITARCLLVLGADTTIGNWLHNAAEGQGEIQRRLGFFPKAKEIVSIPDCGHMVHYDQPLALAQAIKRFLRTSK